MKLKSLAIASLVALSSVSGHAATTDWSSHALLESSVGLSTGGIIFDTYSFTLATASTVASSVGAIGTISPGTYSLFTTGLDGLVGTTDDLATPFAWNFTNVPTVNTVTLSAGSYYYSVFGFAPSVAAYSINSAATAVPVPEPETYAMLLAGLGVVGFVARRRRND